MDHRDLDVWKRGIELTLQMRRNAISVPLLQKAVQGKATKKQCNFYTYMGSSAELETQLIISHKLGYCGISDTTEQITTVKQLLTGLIKYLKTKM